MVKVVHFLLLVILFPFLGYAQANKVTVNGTVLDEQTREPIIGAAISLAGSTEGTVSDADGTFSINLPSLPATISIAYIGYQKQDVDIYEYTEPIRILLSENINFLNEVVVVGYGTQKRSELTSAISNVSKERLQLSVPSVETVLSGAVAGLNVSQTSGQPGAVSNIRIRGGNSITGGNEPLYVIDGFIVYNDVTATQVGTRRSDAILNPLATINPADIESIDVLKDVSATAIYGTRGANGVIIITTKKGTKGSNNVNYQTSFGWNSISRKVEFLDAKQWTELYNEIRTGEGRTGDVLPVPEAGSGANWQDAALRTGTTQTHQLSFIGGDDKSRYAVSGNYTSQEGIILGTGLKRYGGRVNLERDVIPNLRIGVNATGNYLQSHGLNYRGGNNEPNSWIAAVNVPPIVPVYTADGSYNYSSNPVGWGGQVKGGTTNPVADLQDVQLLTENTRVLSIFFAEYALLPELKLKANIGADLSNTKESYYAPSHTLSGAFVGQASIGQKEVYAWQTEYTLNYNKVFNEIHSINGLVGFTSQRTDRKAFTAGSYGFSNDATGYNNLSSGGTAINPSSSAYTSTLNSFLGRISYGYKGKYNATATFRTDGSSRFAKGHQWGYFPSLGVSWNIGKEDFFKSVKSVSHLQVRLSGGTVGNQEIGDFRFISNVVPQTVWFNDVSHTGYIVENLSNDKLKWETTASYNLGANAGFLNDRLNVVADVYYKLTSDLLLQVPVERVTGFSTAMRNVGSVSNKGLELEVDAKIIEKKKLNWRLSVNWARNINRVEDLGVAEYFTPSFTSTGTLTYLNPLRVQKGEPLGSFYGYKFVDIVQLDDDISKFPPQTTEALAPGIARYEDTDKNGVVNEEDRIILGNSQPKFTGGFSSTLTYKQWDFFFAFHGSYGNKLFNTLRARFEKTSTDYNSLAAVADRWTPANPSHTIAKASNSTSIVTDSRFIEDASFLKARNISLGYTLPVRRITKDAKLRLSVSLLNFLTLTSYKGYDPESNRNGIDETSSLYQGVDFGTYPASKSIQFGLSITL